jgi:hypothetical protein
VKVPVPTSLAVMPERRTVLARVLRAEPSLRADIEALRGFPYDAEEPLAVLTIEIARDVLDRHARGRITDADLQAWADALEMRDDVEVAAERLKECLFELSEPVLSGQPMAALAAEWRQELAERLDR